MSAMTGRMAWRSGRRAPKKSSEPPTAVKLTQPGCGMTRVKTARTIRRYADILHLGNFGIFIIPRPERRIIGAGAKLDEIKLRIGFIGCLHAGASLARIRTIGFFRAARDGDSGVRVVLSD